MRIIFSVEDRNRCGAIECDGMRCDVMMRMSQLDDIQIEDDWYFIVHTRMLWLFALAVTLGRRNRVWGGAINTDPKIFTNLHHLAHETINSTRNFLVIFLFLVCRCFQKRISFLRLIFQRKFFPFL